MDKTVDKTVDKVDRIGAPEMIYICTAPPKREYYTTDEDLHQLINRLVDNDTPVIAEHCNELSVKADELLGLKVMVSSAIPDDTVLLISRGPTGQLTGKRFVIAENLGADCDE